MSEARGRGDAVEESDGEDAAELRAHHDAVSEEVEQDDRPEDEARPETRRRLPTRRPHGDDEERITQRLAHQWAQLRDQRRAEPTPMSTGPSNFSRAQVPWGIDLAASWGWRFLVIAAAGYLIFWLVGFFAVVTLPIVIALLIAALVSPVVAGLQRIGLPRGLASLVVVLGGVGIVGALLTFAGQQVAGGASDLADSTAAGLGEIRQWLKDGPLNASESQVNVYIEQAQGGIQNYAQDGGALTQLTEVGAALG
ncbi:MAG: AI-2E family transporter, partial [Nocardioides sp.]